MKAKSPARKSSIFWSGAGSQPNKIDIADVGAVYWIKGWFRVPKIELWLPPNTKFEMHVMSKIFNFESLIDHDLYHLRLGKGALIVALPVEDVSTAQVEWAAYQDALRSSSARDKKLRRLEIDERIKELEVARFELCERVQPGVFRRRAGVPAEDEARVVAEIDSLRKERSALSVPVLNYRSYMQLAMFYTHNLAPNSENPVRFDPVVDINETESHVELSLTFSDQLTSNHKYHQSIMSAHSVQFPQDPGPIEGIVKRVIPTRNVTLEVISRKDSS